MILDESITHVDGQLAILHALFKVGLNFGKEFWIKLLSNWVGSGCHLVLRLVVGHNLLLRISVVVHKVAHWLSLVEDWRLFKFHLWSNNWLGSELHRLISWWLLKHLWLRLYFFVYVHFLEFILNVLGIVDEASISISCFFEGFELFL
jgi:hypothetical protein